MTVVNGMALLSKKPIVNMLSSKHTTNGVSHGLSEAGYDIRIKQDVILNHGDFILASAIEEFSMPTDLVGIVHDKSTWARKGLSVFNTVIEPNFFGGLTLELVYHGMNELHIPAGSGIAQVLFHQILEPAAYAGKYQGQSTNPEPARFS